MSRVITFSDTADLHTNPNRAFWFGVRPHAIADVDPMVNSWQPQELPPRVGIENHMRVKFLGVPMKAVSRFAEFDPPHRFVLDGMRPPPARWMRFTLTFDELPDGTTRFTYLMEIRYPAWGALIARTLMLTMRRAMQTSMRRMIEIFGAA
jgi:hypothetical protein